MLVAKTWDLEGLSVMIADQNEFCATTKCFFLWCCDWREFEWKPWLTKNEALIFVFHSYSWKFYMPMSKTVGQQYTILPHSEALRRNKSVRNSSQYIQDCKPWLYCDKHFCLETSLTNTSSNSYEVCTEDIQKLC